MQTRFKGNRPLITPFFSHRMIIVSYRASDIPRLRAQCIWGNTISVAGKVGRKPTGGNVRARGSLLQRVC